MPALVRELIKDTRKMMSPFTALKLKERKSNRYLIFTGDVHVSLPMLVCVQGKGSLDFVRGCYVHQNTYLSLLCTSKYILELIFSRVDVLAI